MNFASVLGKPKGLKKFVKLQQTEKTSSSKMLRGRRSRLPRHGRPRPMTPGTCRPPWRRPRATRPPSCSWRRRRSNCLPTSRGSRARRRRRTAEAPTACGSRPNPGGSTSSLGSGCTPRPSPRSRTWPARWWAGWWMRMMTWTSWPLWWRLWRTTKRPWTSCYSDPWSPFLPSRRKIESWKEDVSLLLLGPLAQNTRCAPRFFVSVACTVQCRLENRQGRHWVWYARRGRKQGQLPVKEPFGGAAGGGSTFSL
mmetsp:Transcript_50492/g.133015  ORF Transcript_50492/g.133015 Transcript_50492/m.133015 type:complete len:253 (+) Transcript_50492:779-1537(+)